MFPNGQSSELDVRILVLFLLLILSIYEHSWGSVFLMMMTMMIIIIISSHLAQYMLR